MLNAKYDIKLMKVGEHTVPSPIAYFKKDFGKYVNLPFYVVLIKSEKDTILLNTGMPRDMNPLLTHWYNTDPNRKVKKFEKNNTPSAFERLGMKPDKINKVILSPLVSYATGNLDMFPNAEIYMSKIGWEAIMTKHPLETTAEKENNFPNYILKSLVTDWWERIHFLEEVDYVNDDIKVIRTGGHHFSSLLVIVNTQKGRYGFTDSFFTYRNIEENIPIGGGVSLEEALKSIVIAKKECDVIIPMLDESLQDRYTGGIIL